LVPVLAALGGVIFLSENISIRLLLAAIMILGGVGLAVTGRGQSARHPTSRADDRA
jgi:drug/metabolite transporter (DMT)-like permease